MTSFTPGACVALLLVGLCASAAGAPAAGRGREKTRAERLRPRRALWMWASKAAVGLVGDPAAWPGFFDFCAAPHSHPAACISALYLEVSNSYSEATLRAFLAAAHARAVQVEYLFGDGDWQADHLPEAETRCGRILDTFNAAGRAEERFDGLHLDLESAGKWSQRAYRELLGDLRKSIDRYNRTARAAHPPHGSSACPEPSRRVPGAITLAADLGFGWPERGDDSIPQFGDAVRFCDYIVSMAYRDTAGAQASCAVPQALAAARRRKGFYIGAETQHLPNQDYVTYYEEGWDYMEGELARLPGLIAAHGGTLSGIAIHHYDSYLRLPRVPRTSAFADVPDDYWALPYILVVQEAGLVVGFPDATFRPVAPVSRGEAAIFVSRALVGGAVPEGPAVPSFADLPPGHWTYRFVEYAKWRGLLEGDEGGRYYPDAVASRAHVALLIARAMASPTGDAGLAEFHPPAIPTFPDVTPENAWARYYRCIEYLAAEGVARPYPDGGYHPGDACTREQIVEFLVKAFRLPM